MIKNQEPLSLAESLEYLKEADTEDTDVIGFVKKFTSLKPAEAKEMRKKLEALDLMKMKPEHIVKIIDLMPENAEDLNKIFANVGLDEDETKKILDTVKEFK